MVALYELPAVATPVVKTKKRRPGHPEAAFC
jgi:hypothetical protein